MLDLVKENPHTINIFGDNFKQTMEQLCYHEAYSTFNSQEISDIQIAVLDTIVTKDIDPTLLHKAITSDYWHNKVKEDLLDDCFSRNENNANHVTVTEINPQFATIDPILPIEVGDIIISINNTLVSSANLLETLNSYVWEDISLTIKKQGNDNQEVTYTTHCEPNEQDICRLGIKFSMSIETVVVSDIAARKAIIYDTIIRMPVHLIDWIKKNLVANEITMYESSILTKIMHNGIFMQDRMPCSTELFNLVHTNNDSSINIKRLYCDSDIYLVTKQYWVEPTSWDMTTSSGSYTELFFVNSAGDTYTKVLSDYQEGSYRAYVFNTYVIMNYPHDKKVVVWNMSTDGVYTHSIFALGFIVINDVLYYIAPKDTSDDNFDYNTVHFTDVWIQNAALYSLLLRADWESSMIVELMDHYVEPLADCCGDRWSHDPYDLWSNNFINVSDSLQQCDWRDYETGQPTAKYFAAAKEVNGILQNVWDSNQITTQKTIDEITYKLTQENLDIQDRCILSRALDSLHNQQWYITSYNDTQIGIDFVSFTDSANSIEPNQYNFFQTKNSSTKERKYSVSQTAELPLIPVNSYGYIQAEVKNTADLFERLHQFCNDEVLYTRQGWTIINFNKDWAFCIKERIENLDNKQLFTFWFDDSWLLQNLLFPQSWLQGISPL